MNKNIIIVILIVIIIAMGGAFMLSQSNGNGKTNTQINIINNETFQDGEQVQFELKDAQGNALSGKTVEVTLNNQKYTITTDQNGKGYVTISGMSSGNYDMDVNYVGDDTYNGCQAKASITVDTGSAADQPASTSSNTSTTSSSKSSTSGWTYNSEWGVWVDGNGKVVRVGNGNGEQLGVGKSLSEYKKIITSAENNDPTNIPEEYQ